MRSLLICVCAAVLLTAGACTRSVQLVQVTNENGTPGIQYSIPGSGGTAKWVKLDRPFTLNTVGGWPCTPKLSENGDVVTCDFPGVGQGHWQTWYYVLSFNGTPSVGAVSNPGQSIQVVAIAGAHCQNCGLAGFAAHNAKLPPPSAYVSISCPNDRLKVDPTTVSAPANSSIQWLVSGTDPAVTLNFNPSNGTCVGQGNSQITCATQPSSYKVTWDACPNASSGTYYVKVQ